MNLIPETLGKVLVVEDNTIWRELYVATLSDEKYWPVPGATLEAAVDLVHKHYFHAAVIDVRLDDTKASEEGMKVVDLINKTNEDTGVIILTGFGTVDLAVRSFEEFGVSSFIGKGKKFDSAKFIGAIIKATEKSKKHIDGKKRTELTVQNWIKGLSPRDVELGLASGGFDDIQNVIERLLYDLYPLRLHRENAKIETAGPHSILTTHFWSRYLGQPMTLRMANTNALASEIEQIDKLKQVYMRADFGRLTGIIFAENTLEFDEFQMEQDPHGSLI